MPVKRPSCFKETLSELIVSEYTTLRSLSVATLASIENLYVSGLATIVGGMEISGDLDITNKSTFGSIFITTAATVRELMVGWNVSAYNTQQVVGGGLLIGTMSTLYVANFASINELQAQTSEVKGIFTGNSMVLGTKATIDTLKVAELGDFSNLNVGTNATVTDLFVLDLATIQNLTVSRNATVDKNLFVEGEIKTSNYATIQELSVGRTATVRSLFAVDSTIHNANIDTIATVLNLFVTDLATVQNLTVGRHATVSGKLKASYTELTGRVTCDEIVCSNVCTVADFVCSGSGTFTKTVTTNLNVSGNMTVEAVAFLHGLRLNRVTDNTSCINLNTTYPIIELSYPSLRFATFDSDMAVDGAIYIIRDAAGTANTSLIRIGSEGNESFDGSSIASIETSAYEDLRLYSDGTDYWSW